MSAQPVSHGFTFHDMHDPNCSWQFPLAQTTSCFQVTYLGGIEVRVGPHFDAPHTGLVLAQNEIFSVSQELLGNDGRIYLCLSDGRGWVFDDAALFPHDPSVVRYLYAAHAPVVPTADVLVQQPALTFQGNVIPPVPLESPPSLLSGELLASTPSSVTIPSPSASGSTHVSEGPTSSVTSTSQATWYRVAYLGGISLRCGPSVEAPSTGIVLPQNETFPVIEEIPGADGRKYLRLCDGRGWAFDDSALMPHDPSVKRGQWLATNPATNPGAHYQHFQPRVLGEVQVGTLPLRRGRLHPQPRGKRGGKRVSKNRPAAAQNAQSGVER